MKLTQKWLKSKLACSAGLQWFTGQSETDGVRVLEKLLTEKHLSWANWLVVRVMKHKQQIKYAIFAAEQVLDLFEKKYPKDDKPRKAIEAAKAYLAKPSKATKSAAYAAAYAADAAAYAAYAAADAAAYAVAYAANAAADAAYAAADAAYAVAYAANAAADAAAYAVAYAAYAVAYAANAAADAAAYAVAYAAAYDAAYAAMKEKIIRYGVQLLKEEGVMEINDKEFVERVTSETKRLLKEKNGSVITLEFSDGIVLEIVQTKEENYGSRLWIYDKGGEGMSVNEQDFANYIREYYKKHF